MCLGLLPFFAGCSRGPRCAVESALNAWHQLSTPTHALKCRTVDRRCQPSVVTIYEKTPLIALWLGAIPPAHPRSAGDPNTARIASEPCRRRSRSSARFDTPPTLIRRCLLPGRRRNSKVPSANSRSTNCRVTPNRSAAPAGVTSCPGRRTTNCSPFARPSNISRIAAAKSRSLGL